MYQDIQPHHYDNSFKQVSPENQDFVLSYDGQDALLKNSNVFFRYEDVPHNREFHYLFQIDDRHYYLADLHDIDVVRVSIREFRNFQPKEYGFAGITGWQLYLWLKDHHFCGRCGNETIPASNERALYCPNCHNLIYPRIMPAVIVGVTNDAGDLLVTKYANREYQKYALIAGFNEIGETIEETVIREVKEETGLDVSDITYYKCQPWSFSSTLLFGFWAKAHGNQTIKMDQEELSVAKWIHPNEVDVDPHDDASLTAEMIHLYFQRNNKL